MTRFIEAQIKIPIAKVKKIKELTFQGKETNLVFNFNFFKK